MCIIWSLDDVVMKEFCVVRLWFWAHFGRLMGSPVAVYKYASWLFWAVTASLYIYT
jgi:hypothetical protein